MSDCTGCADEKRLAELTEPVRWVSVRVWWLRNEPWLSYVDWSLVRDTLGFEQLPNAILGAIGVRSDGTTDYVSGYDWYGWFPFPDGTWRISGHMGDKAENDRQRKRYPNAVWKEGILVSDAEMARVNEEMSEYQRSLG